MRVSSKFHYITKWYNKCLKSWRYERLASVYKRYCIVQGKLRKDICFLPPALKNIIPPQVRKVAKRPPPHQTPSSPYLPSTSQNHNGANRGEGIQRRCRRLWVRSHPFSHPCSCLSCFLEYHEHAALCSQNIIFPTSPPPPETLRYHSHARALTHS